MVEGRPPPPQTVSPLSWLSFNRPLSLSLSPSPSSPSPLPHNIVVSFYWRRGEGGVPQELSHWLSAVEREGTKRSEKERRGRENTGGEEDEAARDARRLRGRRNGSGEEEKAQARRMRKAAVAGGAR